MANPTNRRLEKILSRTFVVLFLLYFAIGFCGYISLGDDPKEDVDLFIFRKNPNSSDTFMFIGRSFLIISLIIGGAINAFPLKVMIREFFGMEDGFWNNILVSFSIIAVQFGICYNFTEISSFASIAGALTVTIVAVTIPGLMGIKIRYFKSKHANRILNTFIILFTILGISGAGYEIYKQIKGDK